MALPAEQTPRHLAVAAAGQPDQVAASLVDPLLDQCPRKDRELLLSGEVATAGEAGQGGVAGRVAGEQDEVIAGDRAGMQLAGPAAARVLAAKRVVELSTASSQAQLALVTGDGQLEPEDGGDRGQAGVPGFIGPGLSSRLRQADRAVQPRVIRDCQRRHAQHRCPGDQLLRMAGPVQEAEVGVRVELAVAVR